MKHNDSEIEKIKVHFRKFPEGDVIAIWNERNSRPGKCSSYQSQGQHTDADQELIDELQPATPAESAYLMRELTAIGYAVTVA